MLRCMTFNSALLTLVAGLAVAAPSQASTIGMAFYGDPPDDNHPWAVHDGNRPQPKEVTAGTFSSQQQPGIPPSDAVVLFDGTDVSKWVSAKDGSPAKWSVTDGQMVVVPKTGEIRSKEEFGDCQLHVEWAEPADVQGSSQGRGNSGIFLMGLVEIQVLDCYHNPTYADGGAGSVYGVQAPLANPLRPPGEFQVYDIVFRRPIYRDGEMVDPGYVTVFINGVVVQDHAALEGPTGHMKRSHSQPFPEKGPLVLQDHGNPVRFRNIWYRSLPPNVIEGGTDGWLSKSATSAKRKETAAEIREDAKRLKNESDPVPGLLRLMESLVYEKDEAVTQEVNETASAYLAKVKGLAGDELKGKKDEVKRVNHAFEYLIGFNILPKDFGPSEGFAQLVKENHWDK